LLQNCNSVRNISVADAIWQTDLDFMVVHQDRLVVLSFMTSLNHTNFLPTPLPFLTSSVHIPASNLMNVTEDVTLASSVSTAKNQALRSHQVLKGSLYKSHWTPSFTSLNLLAMLSSYLC
jgi:hypothetical protein